MQPFNNFSYWIDAVTHNMPQEILEKIHKIRYENRTEKCEYIISEIYLYLMKLYLDFYRPSRISQYKIGTCITEQEYKQLPKKYRGLYQRPMPNSDILYLRPYYPVSEFWGNKIPRSTVIAKNKSDKKKINEIISQFTHMFYHRPPLAELRDILLELSNMTTVKSLPQKSPSKHPTLLEYEAEHATKNLVLEQQKRKKSMEYIYNLERQIALKNMSRAFEAKKQEIMQEALSPFGVKSK